MCEKGWVHGAAAKVLRREMLAVELEGEERTAHLFGWNTGGCRKIKREEA